MKIRNGFVSNSSSSSFCIFGARMDMDEVQDILNLEDGDDFYELQNGVFKNKLNVHSDCENRCVYIGRDLTSIKDDETGKEFKDSVKSLLRKHFGKEIACEMIQDEIYN